MVWVKVDEFGVFDDIRRGWIGEGLWVEFMRKGLIVLVSY